jgi:hypothetical protein
VTERSRFSDDAIGRGARDRQFEDEQGTQSTGRTIGAYMNQPQEPLRDRKVTLFGTTRLVEGDETAHPRTSKAPKAQGALSVRT